MADVTISSLPLGTPSGNVSIPYSDGNTTYKTSPSAIVAASSGALIQVQSTIVSTVVGPFTNSDGEFMRVQITPKFSTSKLIIETDFKYGCDNPNGYHALQYSADGNVWNTINSGIINNLDDPGSGAYNTHSESHKVLYTIQNTNTHYFRIYWFHVQKNGGTMYMNRPMFFNSQNVIATSSLFVSEIAG